MTFVHLPLSVWPIELFVASLVSMKGDSCKLCHKEEFYEELTTITKSGFVSQYLIVTMSMGDFVGATYVENKFSY